MRLERSATTALLDRPVRSARKAKGEGWSRRSEILEAAQRIFVECGYEGATIRRIADEVGVSSTALYMHFRDKAEILVQICEELYDRLIEVNTGLIALDMDPVLRVRAMLDGYIDFALEHPNVYKLLYCSTAGVPALAQEATLARLGARTFDLSPLASAGVAQARGLRDGDADLAAKISWSATHGIVSLILIRPQYPWGEPRAVCAAALDATFRGLFLD